MSSPNRPRPDDPLAIAVADALRRAESNYHREGSGPGGRFEGQLLEDVQARTALAVVAAREAESAPGPAGSAECEACGLHRPPTKAERALQVAQWRERGLRGGQAGGVAAAREALEDAVRAALADAALCRSPVRPCESCERNIAEVMTAAAALAADEVLAAAHMTLARARAAEDGLTAETERRERAEAEASRLRGLLEEQGRGDEAQEYLTPGEAARRLQVHPRTLLALEKAGDLEVSRTPGGHRRFLTASVGELRAKRRAGKA